MGETCLARVPLESSRSSTSADDCDETETVSGSPRMTDPGWTHSNPQPESFGKGVAANQKQRLACRFAQERMRQRKTGSRAPSCCLSSPCWRQCPDVGVVSCWQSIPCPYQIQILKRFRLRALPHYPFFLTACCNPIARAKIVFLSDFFIYIYPGRKNHGLESS